VKHPEQDQLLRKCLAGKPSAQRRFYERYAPRLYGVCLRYARTETEAQDYLQEAFIRIFRDLNQFRGEGSLEGWLRRITVRTALGALRKERLEFPAEMEAFFNHPASEPTALEALQARDIAAIIRQLPSGYRAVFNLYAIEGYRHAEIAGMLGISEGASRSQYARARKALQNLLTEPENSRRHE